MKKTKNKIYLDCAASTPIDGKVAREMERALLFYGNPSSYNNCGREAREYVEKSRLKISRFLGAHPDEIIFTSSGTEANNLAILGLAKHFNKGEIISTPIEHPSVLKPLEFLKQQGWSINFLKINKEGLVDLNDLRLKLNSKTILVSIMYANNEIGTIEPIVKVSKIIKEFNRNLETQKPGLKVDKTQHVLFHVDACQATGYLDMKVNNLGVDLLTFNGSKIYGPKGIGVLYKKRTVNLMPLMLGGEQEFGLRAGTENIAAIGGLAKAIEIINKKESEKLIKLRDYFISKIKKLIPDIVLNGAIGKQRLPNNINISVPNLSSEVLLLELDKYGICAGSGSACTSHAVEPSHVLRAIGLDEKYLNGALRLSIARQTTKKDIEYVLKIMPKIIKDLKKIYRN
jgi:cysteine desulfurase